MSQKKKIILISTIAILAIILIAGGIIGYFVMQNSSASKEGESKVNQLYNKLSNKKSYSYTGIVDDQNKSYYAKNENMAYTEDTYEGETSKFIIKDGNSYLLVDDRQVYYTYTNNETNLNKIEGQLQQLQDMEYEVGEEEIEQKNYYYEEYKTLTNFAIGINILDEVNEEVITRLYFKGDNLEYVKTIAEGKEELVKVKISNGANNSMFEIPSDYKGM